MMNIDRLIAVGLALAMRSAIAGSPGARDPSQDERCNLRAESAICDAIEATDGNAAQRLRRGYIQADPMAS